MKGFIEGVEPRARPFQRQAAVIRLLGMVVAGEPTTHGSTARYLTQELVVTCNCGVRGMGHLSQFSCVVAHGSITRWATGLHTSFPSLVAALDVRQPSTAARDFGHPHESRSISQHSCHVLNMDICCRWDFGDFADTYMNCPKSKR